MRYLFTLFAVALSLTLSGPAAAYVGPGAGLSLLGALWALLAAVGAALLFLVAWPLRRMRRRRREQDEGYAEAAETGPSEMASMSAASPGQSEKR